MATTPSNVITTTLVISFTDPAQAAAANAFLSAEVDSRVDGLNLGVTNFLIGDSPGFLVYKSPNVTLKQPECTSGSANSAGSFNVEQTEIITFAKTNVATLSKPAVGNSVAWTLIGGQSATLTVNGNIVTASAPILAVYQAKYQAAAIGYRLAGVTAVGGIPETAVIVWLEGTVAQ